MSYGSSEIKGRDKMIEVGNGKVIGWIGEDKHYIGRTAYGKQSSALANIFAIGKDGTRAEVIAKYRIWLEGIIKKGKGAAWQELQALRERYKKGEKVILLCYCKPLGCHGDVLMEFIKEQKDEQVKET
jgi:hypothetical protein